MSEQDQNARVHKMVLQHFKDDLGKPFDMTAGQVQLFRAIAEKQHPRTQFECYTQYGKSDTVSMAILVRACTFPEQWTILGGTKDKADIIMRKVIKHVFENPYVLSKFDVGADDSLERIKRERSKERLTFRVDQSGAIGEIRVLSADARRKGEDAGDILIGHGTPNLIEDDAALIPDAIHGKALRMLGGFPHDNFLLKITNTFGRNHAFRSSKDPKYKKIVIDWQQGLVEGRLTQEFIEEMRATLDPVMFGVLYDCVYPPADMVDDQGWMPLLTEEQVQSAMDRFATIVPFGAKLLGCDIAEGTNFNASVIRQDNAARVHSKTSEKNLMQTADDTKNTMRTEHVTPANTFMDAIGVGAGVASRMHQMGLDINDIKTGEKPSERTDTEKKLDPIEYYNLRAEMTWKARSWILQGGALAPNRDWMQLTKLRYKVDHEKKIKIMSKEEMRLRGLIQASESPDVADAFCLTFAPRKKRVVTMAASPVAADPYGQFMEASPMGASSNQFASMGGASAIKLHEPI